MTPEFITFLVIIFLISLFCHIFYDVLKFIGTLIFAFLYSFVKEGDKHERD